MIEYNSFEQFCYEAAENEEVFKTFKRHPDFIPILEHVTFEQGLGYIEEIKKGNLLNHIKDFVTNDLIGKPRTYFYPELEIEISPTTLRYIKVLADLINLFGNLDILNIIEIGCGYGGQCKIINDIAKPRSYTIVDLPGVLRLSKKYLRLQDIENVISRYIDNDDKIHYDLCISNYAFSEISRNYQDFYAEIIIKNSDMGYITCNFIAPENLTREEIFALKSNHTVYPEKPLTGDGNLIYTWKL